MEPLFERPPVHVSRSGVSSIRPADILRSAAGQREIRKTMDAAIYTIKAGEPLVTARQLWAGTR